ncbi:hypothetical protein F5888DRAFT_1870135 [Russula emetica]|nr:hypothetical protein F5888DRAFT_1870135 [Russula emetica]
MKNTHRRSTFKHILRHQTMWFPSDYSPALPSHHSSRDTPGAATDKTRKGNVTVDDDDMGVANKRYFMPGPSMNVDPHTVFRSLPARVSPRGPYAACTVLYHNGQDWKHVERIFGEMVTESDTALRASIPALDVLTDFMETQLNDSQRNVLIFLPSNFAVSRVLDASPHEEQAVSSMYCLYIPPHTMGILLPTVAPKTPLCSSSSCTRPRGPQCTQSSESINRLPGSDRGHE